MKKATAICTLFAMAIFSAAAFTTKKKERNPRFSANSPKDQQKGQKEEKTFPSFPGSDTTGTFAAFATGNGQGQIVQYYETEEDDDVSYSVALVSCMLSLAVGFGLGYGT